MRAEADFREALAGLHGTGRRPLRAVRTPDRTLYRYEQAPARARHALLAARVVIAAIVVSIGITATLQAPDGAPALAAPVTSRA